MVRAAVRHRSQVAFVDDEQWVGGLASDGPDEPFGEDDLFEARAALVALPHRCGFLYRDSSDLGWIDFRLPPTEMQFVGHGGDYRVRVHWQVHL
ncbi:hypothetical protein ACQPYE_26155 [Actinosynnema sp. CA-299493]